MLYMLVPDPTGEVNGNRRTRDFVGTRTAGVLAHELQHLVEFAALEVEHRAVPPQVMHEVALALPVPLQAGKPGDALVASPLHFHDVRHGVRAPDVGGIELHRAPAGALGRCVVAALLERERLAGKQRRVGGHRMRPMGRDALERRSHVASAPEPEVVEMREPHGEHVRRPRRKGRLPLAQRSLHVAGDPAAKGTDVRLLARRRAAAQGGGIPVHVDRERGMVPVIGEHHEGAHEAVTHRELGIGLERRLDVLRQVRALTQVGVERAVEGLPGRRDRRAERKSVDVFHGIRIE